MLFDKALLLSQITSILVNKIKSSEGQNDVSKEELEALISKEINTLNNVTELEVLSEKLKLLHSFESQYLTLIRDFKEEIKFVNSIQEDLRKERTKFFSENLSLVSKSLKETEIDKNIRDRWIEELVESFSISIDYSTQLTDQQTINKLSDLRKESTLVKKKVNSNDSKQSDN